MWPLFTRRVGTANDWTHNPQCHHCSFQYFQSVFPFIATFFLPPRFLISASTYPYISSFWSKKKRSHSHNQCTSSLTWTNLLHLNSYAQYRYKTQKTRQKYSKHIKLASISRNSSHELFCSSTSTASNIWNKKPQVHHFLL